MNSNWTSTCSLNALRSKGAIALSKSKNAAMPLFLDHCWSQGHCNSQAGRSWGARWMDPPLQLRTEINTMLCDTVVDKKRKDQVPQCTLRSVEAHLHAMPAAVLGLPIAQQTPVQPQLRFPQAPHTALPDTTRGPNAPEAIRRSPHRGRPHLISHHPSSWPIP